MLHLKSTWNICTVSAIQVRQDLFVPIDPIVFVLYNLSGMDKIDPKMVRGLNLKQALPAGKQCMGTSCHSQSTRKFNLSRCCNTLQLNNKLFYNPSPN